jgi:UDP-glucose 4-epimerase
MGAAQVTGSVGAPIALNDPNSARTMARILVSGATGFIGRHLVHVLEARGHSLTILTRQPGHAVRSRRLFPRIAEVLLTDLEDNGPFWPYNAVVHLAGLSQVHQNADTETGSALSAANTELTARLVRYALRSSVTKFIHMSSVLAVAGNKATRTVDDNCEPAPDTEYGRSKLAAEDHVRHFAQAGRLGVSLRPPMVIGSNAKGNWARLMRLASSPMPLPLAGLSNRRSIISIDSLCDAIVHLVEVEFKAEVSGQYAVADVPATSVSEMVSLLREGMGQPRRLLRIPPVVLVAAMRCARMGRRADSITGELVVDPHRFFETFGFQPRWDAHQAIKSYGRQWLSDRSSMTRKRGA